jgi:hypothetical protein
VVFAARDPTGLERDYREDGEDDHGHRLRGNLADLHVFRFSRVIEGRRNIKIRKKATILILKTLPELI